MLDELGDNDEQHAVAFFQLAAESVIRGLRCIFHVQGVKQICRSAVWLVAALKLEGCRQPQLAFDASLAGIVVCWTIPLTDCLELFLQLLTKDFHMVLCCFLHIGKNMRRVFRQITFGDLLPVMQQLINDSLKQYTCICADAQSC